jgi:hypothetical protein
MRSGYRSAVSTQNKRVVSPVQRDRQKQMWAVRLALVTFSIQRLSQPLQVETRLPRKVREHKGVDLQRRPPRLQLLTYDPDNYDR